MEILVFCKVALVQICTLEKVKDVFGDAVSNLSKPYYSKKPNKRNLQLHDLTTGLASRSLIEILQLVNSQIPI